MPNLNLQPKRNKQANPVCCRLCFLFFFPCIAAEGPRDFTPDRMKNFHGKGRLWFREKHSDRKSRFLPWEYQNGDLNFWGCKTQSFCSSLGRRHPLHFTLALVSLRWLRELIFRMGNSTLPAEALNADCESTSTRHGGIAGMRFSSVSMLECLTPDLVVSF